MVAKPTEMFDERIRSGLKLRGLFNRDVEDAGSVTELIVVGAHIQVRVFRGLHDYPVVATVPAVDLITGRTQCSVNVMFTPVKWVDPADRDIQPHIR